MANYPISNVSRRIVYTGSAGVGPYAFPFEVLSSADIAVYKNTTLLTITTNYTVTISPTLGTGSITLVVAATGSDRITITGSRAIERTTDFTTGGDFFAGTVNSEMDSQTILVQQVAETAERSLKAPVTDPTSVNMTLPVNTVRANKFLSFDGSGNPSTSNAVGTYRGNWSAGVGYLVYDIIKDTSNNNIYICLTAHTSVGTQPISSNADVAKWGLLVDAAAAAASEAAAAASASAAAGSASTATTQASNAASSASTATTQAGIATTQAGIATTQATNAAASAASAAAIAGAFVGTSTSSLLIAIGSKSFTTQTSEQYTAGVFLSAVSAANTANFMFGQVTSYNSGTGALVLDVQVIGGSGTYADWNLSLVGARGATGNGITAQSVGWTGTAGTTPKTLTVDDDLTTSQAARLNATNTFASSNTFSSTTNLAYGLFRKADPAIVAFTKTGAFTVSTATTLYAEVAGVVKTIASASVVTMPVSPASGTDYAIWAKTDGTLEATSNFVTPPTANARKIGGFHYAPGGNATGVAGGDTTPAINAYSFYDLKFKPECSDPRGMALVADGFWVDIYLLGASWLTNGTSAYNVTIADGSSPPKIPTKFGGNGTTAYGSLTWWEAAEVMRANGKRMPTYSEFAALAYGTTEATSGGTDPVSTILRAGSTSKWGVMLSTGNLYVWGDEFGGPYGTAAFTANTGGRGSTYNLSNAVRFGGNWLDGAVSGSRCSYWSNAPTASGGDIGARGVCDHLILD